MSSGGRIFTALPIKVYQISKHNHPTGCTRLYLTPLEQQKQISSYRYLHGLPAPQVGVP
jgi:hypothetical protein